MISFKDKCATVCVRVVIVSQSLSWSNLTQGFVALFFLGGYSNECKQRHMEDVSTPLTPSDSSAID